MRGMGAEGDAEFREDARDQMQIRSAGNDLAGLRIYGAITIEDDGLGRQQVLISAPRLAQLRTTDVVGTILAADLGLPEPILECGPCEIMDFKRRVSHTARGDSQRQWHRRWNYINV